MSRFVIPLASQLLENDTGTTAAYPVADNTTCPDQSQFHNIFLHGSVGIAIVIVVIFSFLEKRAEKYRKCCGGRPGLVVPINMLDDFTNKWGYAFAFGAITNTIIIIFTDGSSLEFEGPLIVKVVVALVMAVEMCVNLFPFFACIATEHKIVGSIIGLTYAALWFGVLLYFTLKCMDPVPDMLPYLGLVLQMPTLTCLGALVLWYLVTFSRTVHRKRTKSKDEDISSLPSVAMTWQVKYTSDIFNKDLMGDGEEDLTWKEKLLKFITKYVFAKRPNFEFSTRVFCTVFVVFMCTYQLGVAYFWFSAESLEWFSAEVYTILDLMDLPANNTFVNNVQVSTNMITIGWQVTIAFTLILFVIDTGAIFFRYRAHMLMLYKGDASFMPSDLDTDPAEIMRYCMLYSGFQVAYMIWGFFILNFATWIIILLICFLLILPVMNRNYAIVQYIGEVCLVPFVINFILRISQKAMARSLFLQDKIKPEDKVKPLAINNRKLFHIVNYFFFFANIATGLFSCLFRILKGLALGLVFLGRIDRCVLMPGLESGDMGFCSYLGMLRIEATHNHPILRTFCQILLDLIHTRHRALTPRDTGDPETTNSQEGIGLKQYSIDGEGDDATYRRARRRWWLAYTLIQNPTLIPHRRFDITDVTERHIDVNVIVARKRKYDRLKAELKELEKLMKTGSKADLLNLEDVDDVTKGDVLELGDDIRGHDNKVTEDILTQTSDNSVHSNGGDSQERTQNNRRMSQQSYHSNHSDASKISHHSNKSTHSHQSKISCPKNPSNKSVGQNDVTTGCCHSYKTDGQDDVTTCCFGKINVLPKHNKPSPMVEIVTETEEL